ncbi:MAG: sulfatase-like hydrolase/transferase [Planctomycetia bacterium]|nr:sulfatase-like hydrolase/transferase [Planctomycetia bacterium]
MNSVAALSIAVGSLCGSTVAAEPPRPNILWITSEDHGPHLGCYGDAVATTPNVDRLAARGMIYRHVWSNAPVCAPARTTLISGLYACSIGAEHMRSMVACPSRTKLLPQLLREAGYYCANNAKEDYNIRPTGPVWDDSSGKAHWRNRPAGTPFFAVFNSGRSHEGQIRGRPRAPVHDPASVRVPAYHPDTPEVRRDWAYYYDGVTAADADAGARLKELEDAGLAEDTIICYFSDHGSGMPRSKRWPCDSGMHVPLVVYIPPRFAHLAPPDYVAGGRSDRLVSFVDFAPSVLSLAGIRPPAWMQGQAFLGQFQEKPRQFVFGFRGRMDERTDLVRSATDGRYVYLRNYMPHRIYGQHVDYMFQTPTTRVWKKLHDEGKLNAAQDAFWNRKPTEELYDLASDADEVHNLADSPEHRDVLARLRQAQREHAERIRDVGFLPEGEMHARAGQASPYDMAHDDNRYPFERVFATAELASMLAPTAVPGLKERLTDRDSAVRYWAALGLLMRGTSGLAAARGELKAALGDESPYVRIAAAEALGQYGDEADRSEVLSLLVKSAQPQEDNVFVSLAALQALDALGDKAAPVAAEIKRVRRPSKLPDPRYAPYVPRLIADMQ